MLLSDRIFFFFFCWGDRGKRTPASPEGYCRELASLQTGFLQLCFGAGEGSAAGAAFVWVGAGAAPLALPWGAPAAPWGHLHKLPWPLGFILPPCSVPQAPH